MEDVQNNPKRTGGVTGKGFLPGRSGNPGGRPKKTPITDALRILLNDPKSAEKLAKAVLIIARRSPGHFKEICERVEGSVPRAVEVNGEIEVNLAERLMRQIEKLDASGGIRKPNKG